MEFKMAALVVLEDRGEEENTYLGCELYPLTNGSCRPPYQMAAVGGGKFGCTEVRAGYVSMFRSRTFGLTTARFVVVYLAFAFQTDRIDEIVYNLVFNLRSRGIEHHIYKCHLVVWEPFPPSPSSDVMQWSSQAPDVDLKEMAEDKHLDGWIVGNHQNASAASWTAGGVGHGGFLFGQRD
nr:hypothetical protein BaRGS_011569 [Batillaria attramentaria]